jgi:hypothetical protein
MGPTVHRSRVLAEFGGTMALVGVRDVLVGADHLRDGRITEIWSYDSNPFALDEFWSQVEQEELPGPPVTTLFIELPI